MAERASSDRTWQPAISHKVANLEKHFATRLLERSRTGVTLTDAGKRFHESVSTGLGIIRAAVAEIAAWPGGEQVVIACSHDASHFWLLQRYQSLREALGERVSIRILTFHYDMRNLPPGPSADVLMEREAKLAAQDRVVIQDEAVRPVCSSGYAATDAGVLRGPVSGWSGLTFLKVTRPDETCTEEGVPASENAYEQGGNRLRRRAAPSRI